MKKTAIILACAAIVGCSSAPKTVEAPIATAIGNQKLATTFKRQGIKIEWDCSWTNRITNPTCSDANIKSIEVTAYAPSNGNTETNRETAFKVAEIHAKAKLRHFIQEEVYSTNTVNTLTKNIEKANDRIKNRITNNEEVSMSDDEASKDTNWAIRENSNSTARTVVETVRKSAQGILRGVYVTDQSIVDRQTVGVTIRWDAQSNSASMQLRKAFGN